MNKLNNKKKENNSSFYLPGQEINLGSGGIFSSWNNNQSQTSGYFGKNRVNIVICCCLFAYFLVALRLFGICILPNINETEERYFTA